MIIIKKLSENNVCFLYIPFSINNSKNKQTAKQFLKCLSSNCICEKENVDTSIFYNYISRRFCNQKNHLKNCYIFSICNKNPKVAPIFDNTLSISSPIRFENEKSKVYTFKIKKIQIVYFGDSIGFFIFQISFLADEIDTSVMANSLYFLKKTTLTKISINNISNRIFSLYDLSVKIINEITDNKHSYFDFQCFFHISKSHARSNYLLMAKVDANTSDTKCKNALYYLNNGFCDKYQYRNSSDNIDSIYFAPNGRCWGISPESSVCLIRFCHKQAEEKMFTEFKKSYFLLYTFILYQKYSYYNFLTKIYVSKNMSTRKIKRYHNELIDFEIDSVFSIATEIPQYMGFYQRHLHVHNLDKLRADVCDPINKLNESRKNKTELFITILGIVFSIIGLISVFIDVISLCLSLCE